MRGVLAIRGQAAARGYGFIAVEGREDDVFVLGSEVTDEHGVPATRGEWSALNGRSVEIGDVITTGRGDQASNVRLRPVENASSGGAEASTADSDARVPEDAANEEPWAAETRAHLERRGWTQGELASRSSLKPNTVGAVLRGDPTSTRTLIAIAAGFGVGVAAALFDGGGPPEPADHWTAALEYLTRRGGRWPRRRSDATPRPELTPNAAADVERAVLTAHRALEAIGGRSSSAAAAPLVPGVASELPPAGYPAAPLAAPAVVLKRLSPIAAPGFYAELRRELGPYLYRR